MWIIESGELVAAEPTAQELSVVAPALAGVYNENARMLAHSVPLSPEEVLEWYDELRGDGGRPFLLRANGVLVGDADLRRIDDRNAEFAIVIGGAGVQGRGLGTRFAQMVHALAFRKLGVEQLYVSIVPENVASRRLFEKLGYVGDDGAFARQIADEDSDVTMVVDRGRFEAAVGSIEIRMRDA
jgi:RimJ/RimL family protein N-acetyltransferase